MLNVGSFSWLIILGLILIALIAILIVLCFFKYKQIQNEKLLIYGGALGYRENGHDDGMAEAHELEAMTRNREQEELFPESEKGADEKAGGFLTPGDAKAAEAYGPGAELAPPSDGKGPMGTGGSQSVLNLNPAVPPAAGLEPPNYPVPPPKPPKRDDLQGSRGQLFSPSPAELQEPLPKFPPSTKPKPQPPIPAPPAVSVAAYPDAPSLNAAAPGGYYPVETQEPPAVAAPGGYYPVETQGPPAVAPPRVPPKPKPKPKAPLPPPDAPNNGQSPSFV